jgi:hypothetical protein
MAQSGEQVGGGRSAGVRVNDPVETAAAAKRAMARANLVMWFLFFLPERLSNFVRRPHAKPLVTLDLRVIEDFRFSEQTGGCAHKLRSAPGWFGEKT